MIENLKKGQELMQILIYFNRHVVSIMSNISLDSIYFEMNLGNFIKSYASILTDHPNFNKPICPNNSLTSPSKTILLSYLTEEPTSFSLFYDLITDSLKLFDINPTEISNIKDELKLFYDGIGNNLLNCSIDFQNDGSNQKIKIDIEKLEVIEKKMFIKTKNNK
jgi:hypothetical protein